MLPCANCNKPILPTDFIIYWANQDEVKDFIHIECEEEWRTFCTLRGDNLDNHEQGRAFHRTNQQETWHKHALIYYRDLILKGMLPNDQTIQETPTDAPKHT